MSILGEKSLVKLRFPCLAQVTDLTPEQAAKISSMSSKDFPIEDRRCWYNALNRRMNRGNLKPGLLEKYMAAQGSQRWEMVKAFMIDPDMFLVCI